MDDHPTPAAQSAAALDPVANMLALESTVVALIAADSRRSTALLSALLSRMSRRRGQLSTTNFRLREHALGVLQSAVAMAGPMHGIEYIALQAEIYLRHLFGQAADALESQTSARRAAP